MHDVGKPKTRRFGDDNVVTFHHHDVVGAKLTRKRMQALKFSNDQIDAVAKLVELHLRFHGYGSGEWTDAAVRRYVRDAGDQLPRLHVLTRADCTTRNRRKADLLRRTYDDLEKRIERLSEEEELASIRPDLDGNQIMEVLGIGPGREVGEAYRHLLELRLDHGPMGEEQAKAALLEWHASRSLAQSELRRSRVDACRRVQPADCPLANWCRPAAASLTGCGGGGSLGAAPNRGANHGQAHRRADQQDVRDHRRAAAAADPAATELHRRGAARPDRHVRHAPRPASRLRALRGRRGEHPRRGAGGVDRAGAALGTVRRRAPPPPRRGGREPLAGPAQARRAVRLGGGPPAARRHGGRARAHRSRPACVPRRICCDARAPV